MRQLDHHGGQVQDRTSRTVQSSDKTHLTKIDLTVPIKIKTKKALQSL